MQTANALSAEPVEHAWQHCNSSPEEIVQEHQCAIGERRCVYCNVALLPEPCNGCGKWLTLESLHEREFRCADCI